MVKLLFDVAECVDVHAYLTRVWNQSGAEHDRVLLDGRPTLLGHVVLNHWHNHRIWVWEDQARRVDCDDSTIARVKRAIDRENQFRNDEIERIDDEIRSLLDRSSVRTEAEAYSETPGAIVDRLSILALRQYHMDRQAVRETASPEHRERCRRNGEALREQSVHLSGCLTTLMRRLGSGEARFMPARHFKMYNDPALNRAMHPDAGSMQPTRESS